MEPQAPTSGAGLILGGLRGDRAARPETPAPTDAPSFWRDFVRVETDRIILLLLIVFLHFVHADDKLQAAAIGGLIMSIQGQRYSRTR